MRRVKLYSHRNIEEVIGGCPESSMSPNTTDIVKPWKMLEMLKTRAYARRNLGRGGAGRFSEINSHLS